MTKELQKLVIRLVGDGSAYKKTLDNALKNTQQAATSIANAGRKMRGVGMAMSLGITLPVAGMVKSYASFDDAMTKSTAIMSGVSKDLRAEMEATAQTISRKSVTSARDLAESYFFLASAGLDAEKSIAALPKVEQFAVAGAFDMATATDLLTDAQAALALTSEDAAKNLAGMVMVSDALVKANTLANASVAQFSSAITNEAGAAISKFNLDLEEGIAMLAVYADQGLKGNAAGSAFARSIRLTTKAINDNRDVYQKLNIDVEEFAATGKNFTAVIEGITEATKGMGPAQKMATLQMLGFEAISQQAIMPLLGNAEAIREYRKELLMAGGTTGDVANKQLASFSAQMKILWNQIIGVSQAIGEELAPYIAIAAEYIQALTAWFHNLSAGAKSFIARAVGIAAVLGPLLVVLGTLVTVAGAAAAGLAALASSGVVSALSGLVVPIAAITAGVVALGVAAKKLIDHIWGPGALTGAFHQAQEVAKEWAANVVGFISNIDQNFKVLVDWLPRNWRNMVDDMTALFLIFVKNMAHNTKVLVDTIARLFTLWVGYMSQTFERVFTGDFLKWAWKGIGKAAKAFAKFAAGAAKALQGIFTPGGSAAALKLVDEMATKYNKELSEGMTTDSLTESATNIIKKQTKELRGALDGFESTITEGPKFITESNKPATEGGVATDAEAIEAASDAIKDIQENSDIKVTFNVAGVDAVMAGSAEALARLEEFRALQGSTANAAKGTVRVTTNTAKNQPPPKGTKTNHAALMAVLDLIEENTRSSKDGSFVLSPASV